MVSISASIYFRPWEFFHSCIDVFDAIIVIVSFTFTVIYTAADLSGNAVFAK